MLPWKRRSPCLRILNRPGLPSPRTQRRASRMLLFPHPLGPTTAVKWSQSAISWLPPKLLKPLIWTCPMDNAALHPLFQ